MPGMDAAIEHRGTADNSGLRTGRVGRRRASVRTMRAGRGLATHLAAHTM